VFSITLSATAGERDELIAELWEAGTTGITESEDWIRAFFEDADAVAMMQRYRDYHPLLERVDDLDWIAESQNQWQPFPVGERFYLVPDWRDDPAPCGRIRLKIHPGMACGTGTHPATQLCLRAMEQHVCDGMSLLDVGTGTGILAEAARLLGADPVFGCDLEPGAAGIARKNLAGSMFVIPVFAGSVRSVRNGAVDAIVANLNLATLQTIKNDMARVLRDTGTLILSGFRDDELPRVAALFARPARGTYNEHGWACLVL
jgi:ribosomal protein L11 methyltransferase